MRHNIIFFLIAFAVMESSSFHFERLSVGEPFAVDPPVFPSNDGTHPLQPQEIWGSLKKAPYPTNSWFINLALNQGNNPIMTLPYLVAVVSNGVQICYPQRIVEQYHIYSTFLENLALLCTEGSLQTEFMDYDHLSIQVNWNLSPQQYLSSPLVRGQPYITVTYSELTPLIGTQHAIISVNGNFQPGVVTDTKFVIQLNNDQTWIVYTLNNQSISFAWGVTGMTSTQVFSGTLRAALLLNPEDEEILDAHVDTYAVGASVSYQIEDGNKAIIEFDWVTNDGPSDLLTLALPHHMDTLIYPTNQTLQNSYRTIKGNMTGLLGNKWQLWENLTQISWFSPSGIDTNKIPNIKSALLEEISQTPNATDPYFFGKEVARMARLALIADELQDEKSAKFLRESIKKVIDPWLNANNSDNLMYDSTWGGICSKQGLLSPDNDFGQGWYNDHHFHYGYFLYASAVVGKEDQEWLQANQDPILDLARDFGNPSAQDPYFTVTRHKDWFCGHSWASGLFEFADSKDQESTSEAVNSYYSLYLLGLAMNNSNMADFGRLLLAMEIRSAQKYWQIKDDSIYDPIFVPNTVVGILWSDKVDYATWFGANTEFIHCIQMIPFTPISEELLPSYWVKLEYPVLSTALNRTSPPLAESWRGFIYMDLAIIDKSLAWDFSQKLQSFDDGNSRTNTYYWVATRP